MVNPPSSANTRLGEWMPSRLLKAVIAPLATLPTASVTQPMALRMPLARPCTMLAPNSVNLAGTSNPNHCNTGASAA